MKILIIDDDSNRIKEIINEIKEEAEIKDECDEIDYCMEIIEGKRKLSDTYYDLLILDIMLPKRLGECVLKDGGIQLLDDIKRKEKYKLPGIIIGMTSDKDVVKTHKNKFFSIMHYDLECINWKKDLINYIKLGLDTIDMKEKSSEIDYKYDVGIICAVKHKELYPVREIFDLNKECTPRNDCMAYYEGGMSIDDKKIKIVGTSCDEMGLTATTVATMKLIERYRPRFLFMTGICAGNEEEVDLGDIIVADPIWNYGNGKYSEKDGVVIFEPDPKPLRIDVKIANIIEGLSENKTLLEDIKQGFKGIKPNNKLRCKKGAFASGDAVIATRHKINNIKEQSRKLLGIDMESYAVHYAGNYCTKINPKVITFKSVSDFGNNKKGDSYQEYAAYTSGKFLYKVVEELFSDD